MALIEQYKEVALVLSILGILFILRYVYKGIRCLGHKIKSEIKGLVIRTIEETWAVSKGCEHRHNDLRQHLTDARRLIFKLIQHLDLKETDPNNVRLYAYMTDLEPYKTTFQATHKFGEKVKKGECHNLARVPFDDEYFPLRPMKAETNAEI